MYSYDQKSLLFKALSDSTRLKIVDMISSGELCACKILEKLNITQPTLSHHMKILCACGLINSRKEGKWTYYSLNSEATGAFTDFICALFANKPKETCKEGI